MRVIDSHTEGEPTRTIIDANLDLGKGAVAERAIVFAKDYRTFCGSVLKEPRGNDAYVGALIVDSFESDCAAGIIFFNTVQNLGMCGHGTIGVAATMKYLGLIELGKHRFETAVGKVDVELLKANSASVKNVESFRYQKNVKIVSKKYGVLVGDVAWGGNWFFLVKDSPINIELENLRSLTDLSLEILDCLDIQGVKGTDGAKVDHVELFGPPKTRAGNSRNFVLVPSGSYDRSPCGTGCSAKMACLAADDEWPSGRVWIQESIIGSTYALSYENGSEGGVIVTLEGSAFVTAELTLVFNNLDPYRMGI